MRTPSQLACSDVTVVWDCACRQDRIVPEDLSELLLCQTGISVSMGITDVRSCGLTCGRVLQTTDELRMLRTLCAGVAHNKILAKFASGMHKPAQQTIVTLECVPGLMAATPIPKLRQLGGKFGEEIMHALQISTVGEHHPHSILAMQPQLQALASPSACRAPLKHVHRIGLSVHWVAKF